MTEIILKYPSIEALAHSMHDEAELSEHRPYTPRPYNYYAPSDSMWWLVPSTDWPAYHHGKYVFVGSPSSSAHLLGGLHIEKGFGDIVLSLPGHPPRPQVLTKDWAWWSLVKTLRNGTLAQAAQEVAASAGQPVLITIRLQCPPDYSQFDPYTSYSYYDGDPEFRPPYEAGWVTFQCEAEGLRLESQRWLNKDTIHVTNARMLSELAGVFDRETLKWLWVDFYIGVQVRLATDVPQCEVWSAPSVWRKLFNPWRSWVI